MRTVELQDELAMLLEQTQQPLEKGTREAVVLELYRRGIISSGKAGELLGMPRFDFVRYADKLGIPFFRMSKEEWETEKAAAEDAESFVGFIKDAPEGRCSPRPKAPETKRMRHARKLGSEVAS